MVNANGAESNYRNNRQPLKEKEFIALPLGAIKPHGWLEETLIRQKNGMTGQLDRLYPSVMGDRNGWLGGDGDQWERGPYWIDGLLPLAYILNDDELKAKAQRWVEWALNSQREDGYFGPYQDYPYEKGLQRNNSQDWWPKMVVIKFLQQYYSATGDERVINLLTKYFDYQLKTLKEKPLGHWTFWAEYREGDNLQAVYWLYNITGDRKLLELGELLHSQGYDFIDMFTNSDKLAHVNTIHCVNLAQGIKEPVIYYQQSHDQKHVDAVKKGFADIKLHNGFVNGMYGGDEALHGNVPTQGSELCSAVELMYSLELMAEITGDVEFADHLEKIAFNVLPTQITDDFMARQYFQQPNQVMVTRHIRNFDINHGETDLVFGLLSGYPCCTSNFHQGWPKFTQSLWSASKDNGAAALVYAPSEVTMKVANGVEINIVENTLYPVDDKIDFDLTITSPGVASVEFPLYLRIPGWCKEATITVNGKTFATEQGGTIARVDRTWKTGDKVTLTLPMEVRTSEWFDASMGVERGPLVYALKIGEKWEKKKVKDDPITYGDSYWEVRPTTPWNYGIMNFKPEDTAAAFVVKEDEAKKQLPYFWNLEGAPIEIKVKAKKIPSWTLYNEMAGPVPYSRMIYGYHTEELPEEEVTLIPYGCTTLRISQFPVIQEWKK